VGGSSVAVTIRGDLSIVTTSTIEDMLKVVVADSAIVIVPETAKTTSRG